jgi:hypothetical protein
VAPHGADLVLTTHIPNSEADVLVPDKNNVTQQCQNRCMHMPPRNGYRSAAAPPPHPCARTHSTVSTLKQMVGMVVTCNAQHASASAAQHNRVDVQFHQSAKRCWRSEGWGHSGAASTETIAATDGGKGADTPYSFSMYACVMSDESCDSCCLLSGLLLLLLSVCLSQRLWDLTRKSRTEYAFWNRFQLHEIDTIHLDPAARDPFRHGRCCNKVFVLIYNQILMSLDHRGRCGGTRRY